jgi:pyruvate dehydrogenase E2 component (dihydrolipoamide acetyltransferase)
MPVGSFHPLVDNLIFATTTKEAALAELIKNLEKPVVDYDPELVAELEQMGIPAGTYEVLPLDRLRGLVARRMTEAARDIPHFSLSATIEVNAFLAARARFNDAQEVRVSVNDLVIKAVGMTLDRCQGVNASYTPKGIILHKSADVAFAVAMEGGLVTPIVRDAGAKPIAALAQETKDLAARGKMKRLKPAEYTGGTFTVSNLGMFGVDSFGSIINPPQACILSVGATRQVYVPGETGPRIASVITFTLTCDHRVVDGAIGAGWLQEFRSIVEAPAVLVG